MVSSPLEHPNIRVGRRLEKVGEAMNRRFDLTTTRRVQST
jgi:hypothetical protein